MYIPFPTKDTFLLQNVNGFSSANQETNRDTGEKAASAVGGSHLSFSKILAEETEKHRRRQQFKQRRQKSWTVGQ